MWKDVPFSADSGLMSVVIPCTGTPYGEDRGVAGVRLMDEEPVSPYLPADVISVDQLDSCSILCGKSSPSVSCCFCSGSCQDIGSGD